MISGDNDFVPAAKHARRAGIDFILDPMWANISESLCEHVDGVREGVTRPPGNKDDPLQIDNMSTSSAPEDDNDSDEL